MNEEIKINWYRCKVDRKLMSELMKASDFRAFFQVISQLGLFVVTGTLAYLAYLSIRADNWHWSLPLCLGALFIHGTFSSFLGFGGSCHELSHKTPFKTKYWNEFFLKLYCFISWSDYVGFRLSHVKHHQVTVYHDLDAEVVLPQTLDWQSVRFYLGRLIFDPYKTAAHIWGWVKAARGDLSDWHSKGDWLERIMPESKVDLRREHIRWARTVLFGQLALAAAFIATGNWFLVIVFNLGAFYSGWLAMMCGMAQHIGLTPDVPDFRLSCRTFTCNWLPGFLYWNMQYHVEHHMFPAVPFYNLPRLRKAIEHDVPKATHGLWATWKEIIGILKKQKVDPAYSYMPPLPNSNGEGERVNDKILESEAAPQPA